MRILVLGGTGMLGHKLVQELGTHHEVWTTIRREFSSVCHYGLFHRERTFENIDLTVEDACRKAIETAKPDIVINAAGIVKQLPASADVLTCLSVNSIFPHRLASYSEEYGFRAIFISSDCVFDGTAGSYRENDHPNARDLYGMSKMLGEIVTGNCITLRTSLIGRELGSSHGLVEWFLGNRGQAVQGFAEAIFNGFPTIVFADIINMLVDEHAHLNGLFHVAASPITKFELLNLINRRFNADVTIVPSTDLTINRSLDARRFNTLTGYHSPSWEEMIDRMVTDPTPYEMWIK